MQKKTQAVQAIQWQRKVLCLLDQRQLPVEEVWIECQSSEDVAQAIRSMVVRGAPAIGIAAAYGLALGAQQGADFEHSRGLLAESRPTAVNLHWALDRMARLESRQAADLLLEAQQIHQEDLAQNLTMADLGASLLSPGANVLTHCNTGALATGGHGTALGVIRTAWGQGKIARVFNTETRPWLQGARLTAWELMREGISSQLIADGAAAHLMRTQKIDWVIVGADRIARNGDTANKVGTYALAIIARQHGAKFMVVAPSSSFDLNCAEGSLIPIEMRDDLELTRLQDQQLAPAGARAWNPVFDVTPAAMIDAIICEQGIVRAPYSTGIRALLG